MIAVCKTLPKKITKESNKICLEVNSNKTKTIVILKEVNIPNCNNGFGDKCNKYPVFLRNEDITKKVQNNGD